MNRNAKKVSRPVLVATLVVTVGAASFSGLKAETPQSGHRGQTARNGNVHPRTKLGKAYSHLFSFHNPGANEGRVQGFAEATDLQTKDGPWGGEPGNRRMPQAGNALVWKDAARQLGIRCPPSKLPTGERRSSTREK